MDQTKYIDSWNEINTSSKVITSVKKEDSWGSKFFERIWIDLCAELLKLSVNVSKITVHTD